MPHAITPRQFEYLEFIRKYIEEYKCAPSLKEIARHFGVTSPTAHKTLRSLQDNGYLYFARDQVTGYYIRVPKRIGTTAPFFEIVLAGKVNKYGEIMDFPKKYSHFPTTVECSGHENLFALELWQHIPNNQMQAGDIIIFEEGRKPQRDNIGIIRWGNGWLLVRLYSPRIDKDLPFFSIIKDDLAGWGSWIKEQTGQLFWWPLAHSKETDDYFGKATAKLNVTWKPIPIEYILATAVRLERPLTI